MKRTRSTNATTLTPVVSYDHTAVNGNKTSYTYGRSTNYFWTGNSKQISDETHPGYAKRKAKGAIIMGNMHLTNTTCSFTDKSCTQGPHPTWGTRVSRGNFFGYATRPSDPVTELDSFLSQMKALALIKAYAEIDKGAISSAEYVAELSTTIGMLRRPFKNSRKLIGKIVKARDGLLKTTSNFAEASANAWLEYRYGWKPILSDVAKVVTATHDVRERMQRRRLVARGRESLTLNREKAFSVSGGIPTWDTILGSVESKNQLSASAGVIYEVRERTATSALSQYLCADTHNTPQNVWNILPYSFVVDWFVNVGDWLAAVTPNPNISVRGNWVTTVHEKDLIYSKMQIKSLIGTVTYTDSLNDIVIHSETVDRECNQSISSTPVMTVDSLSWQQSIDAVSLSLGATLKALRGIGRR